MNHLSIRRRLQVSYKRSIRLAEIVIGSLMVVSAWSHFQNQLSFYLHVAQYKVLPVFALRPFVLTIPWLLLLTGVILITRSSKPAGAWLGAGLFSMFSFAQMFVIWRRDIVDCGCFGPMISEEVGIGTACRVVLLAFGCVLIALSGPVRQSPSTDQIEVPHQAIYQ